MDKLGVKDTTAFKIVRQITDHVYGPDTEISDDDFVNLFRSYGSKGGSWERLMAGDIKCVKIIEEVIDGFMNNRKLVSVATRVAQKKYR
jgi:hypothetical protein